MIYYFSLFNFIFQTNKCFVNRELYLDGNDLQCEGTLDLIKLCADHAEVEAFQRAEEARIKEEEAALAAEQGGNEICVLICLSKKAS